MEIAFIDHYDSFSFNLIDWLADFPEPLRIRHIYFDNNEEMGRLFEKPLPLVLSPGPNRPTDVQSTLRLTRELLYQVPILGVCLGHQVLGVVHGTAVKPVQTPFHGSVKSLTTHCAGVVFPNKSKITAATYNSLCLTEVGLPSNALVTIRNEQQEIEMVEYHHRSGYPAVGVQFHPESFMSSGVEPLETYFCQQVQRFYSSTPQ